MTLRPLGRMPRSQQRDIFALGDGRALVVITFCLSDIKIFDGYEDGSVRNWTPLFSDRHAWDAESALRHYGKGVA